MAPPGERPSFTEFLMPEMFPKPGQLRPLYLPAPSPSCFQKTKTKTNKKPFTSNRTSEPGNGTMTKAIPYTNGWPAQCASWVTLRLPQLIGTAMFFTLAQTMKLCPKLPGYEFLLFVPSLFPRLQKVLVCK